MCRASLHVTVNNTLHAQDTGETMGHLSPLSLSCKQSATDKHFTRNPLSSQQPQSAPVCAMSSSQSSVYCFIANNTSADLIMMSPSHVTHASSHIERIILCQKTWRELRWYQQVTGCEAVCEAHYQTGNARSKLRQNYLGASLTKLNINISPR